MKQREKGCAGESGQSMVEFALVLPLFLLIVLFIIDSGWISYQKSSFDHGYHQASWSISASELGDSDALESVPSECVYSGAGVTELVRREMHTGTVQIDDSNLTILNAQARLYNKEESFQVPGSSPGEVLNGKKWTRYLDLTATVEYSVKPITYVGTIFFGDSFVVKKQLSQTKIVRAQLRSE